MDIGLMEERLKQFEEDVFSDKEINTNDFYQLKKDLLDSDNSKLLMKHRMIEQMIEKNANDLLNRRLNLLTIWSTIFLPLSFYTGLFGMNFDDIPFLNNHHGFWIFTVLSIVTIVVMYRFFKKNKWV
jgi:magnesium transporter